MDAGVKAAFDSLCQQFGMSANTAMNIFANAVVKTRSIPFKIEAPAQDDTLTAFEAFKALYESKNSALQTFRKSYSAKANKSLFEGKALTSEEKMDRWHNGSRKENIKACSEEKLKEYRKICRAKGYAEEAKQINAELRARKSVSESFVLEAKSDNSGLRNSVLYGFLLRKVAPIVAATVTEAGFAANVHDSSASKDKVADVKVDIKGRGINGINKLNINYYNPGEPVMGVSNSKFASGSVKTDPTFGLAFVSEERVYIIPKPILQRNWGKLMSTDRSIQMVKDALGMRSEITICDASKMMELAENEGYVYTMSAANAAKYRTELNKYLGVEDANAPVTESLSEAEDPFAVEPVPGEAGKYLAKKILQNTLYAIEDPQKRQSCLNNYKKVFLSGDNSEFKSFVLEIQTRIKQGDNNW
jgi:addiction module RelB/DinJ family antitoxin